MAEYRILRNNATKVFRTFYDVDEETPVDATPQSTGVTYVVTEIDGTAVASGTATYEGTAGRYSIPVPASSRLNRLVLTWSAAGAGTHVGAVVRVDYVDICEAYYFEVPELRAMDGLSDRAKYSSANLAEARLIAENTVDVYTRVAWVPRFEREVLDGMDYTILQGQYRGIDYQALGSSSIRQLVRVPCMTKKLIQVKLSGVVQDISTWTLSEWGRMATGGAILPPTLAGQNVDVAYEWGYYAPEWDLRRAALRLARQICLVQNSSIPDRAHMMQTEFGSFNLTIASEEFVSGLPEVDAILQQHREWVPRFA